MKPRSCRCKDLETGYFVGKKKKEDWNKADMVEVETASG